MPESDGQKPKQPAPFKEVEDSLHEIEPEFIELDDPPLKKRYWLYAALACVVAAGIYVMFIRSKTDDAATIATHPSPPGWDDLVPCSDTVSFDGTKNLALLDDRRAILRAEKGNDGKDQIVEGLWSFDENSKRYAVTLDGMTTTYSIASLPSASAGICMLIVGDLTAADLRASWFSSPNEDDLGDYHETRGPEL
jgi:hypothetical protein